MTDTKRTPRPFRRDAALADLQAWLGHDGNRRNLPLRAEQRLRDYAQLPVRRFSNLHTEQAAAYVRVPPTAALSTMGQWIEAGAVADVLAHGRDPFEAWRRAAAWRYWGLAIQLARHAAGDIQDPHVHSDHGARGLFLLATVGDRINAERLARGLLRLRAAGFLKDAGSKCGPFALSLIEHWLMPEDARNVAAFRQSFCVDSSGACLAYQALIDSLRTSSQTQLDAALLAACQAHEHEARASTDEETFDFDAPHEALMPFDLLCFLQIRRWLGLPAARPAHPLLDVPAFFLVQDGALCVEPLLQQVLDRAIQVLPGRQGLHDDFGAPVARTSVA